MASSPWWWEVGGEVGGGANARYVSIIHWPQTRWPPLPLCSEQKVDNVCRFVLLLLAQMCSLAISLYCRLMSIGVSTERAGDGLFMAFLMRAIIQKMPGTREKVYNG